jgi:hypothetical protein
MTIDRCCSIVLVSTSRSLQSSKHNREHSYTFKEQLSSVAAYGNTFEDFLERKSIEINDDDSTIQVLHRCVDDIERALKIVSDKLLAICQENNLSVIPQLPDEAKLNMVEQNSDDPMESYR